MSAIAGASSAAEKPLTVRAYWNSGLTLTPLVAKSAISWRCAAKIAAVQRRSCPSLACPPAAATRSASDGPFSSTMTRCPTDTGTGGEPTRPYQELAGTSAGLFAAAVACSRTAAIRAAPRVAATATTRRSAICGGAPSGRGRVRIDGKVAGCLPGLPVPGRRRDHRGVVRAQRERRERRAAEGTAQLGVRGYAANDRHSVRSRLLNALHECADDRALVARGQVGPATRATGNAYASGSPSCASRSIAAPPG